MWLSARLKSCPDANLTAPNEHRRTMEHRILPHTDLEVSRFCFGTMTFGKPLDQAGSTQAGQPLHRGRHQLLRHRQHVQTRRRRNHARPRDQGPARPTGHRQQGVLQDGRCSQTSKGSRARRSCALSTKPAASANRLPRSLLLPRARSRRCRSKSRWKRWTRW